MSDRVTKGIAAAGWTALLGVWLLATGLLSWVVAAGLLPALDMIEAGGLVKILIVLGILCILVICFLPSVRGRGLGSMRRSLVISAGVNVGLFVLCLLLTFLLTLNGTGGIG